MGHPGSGSQRLIQHDTLSRSHSGSLQTPLSDSLDKQPTPFPPTQSATLSHRLPAGQLKARERGGGLKEYNSSFHLLSSSPHLLFISPSPALHPTALFFCSPSPFSPPPPLSLLVFSLLSLFLTFTLLLSSLVFSSPRFLLSLLCPCLLSSLRFPLSHLLVSHVSSPLPLSCPLLVYSLLFLSSCLAFITSFLSSPYLCLFSVFYLPVSSCLLISFHVLVSLPSFSLFYPLITASFLVSSHLLSSPFLIITSSFLVFSLLLSSPLFSFHFLKSSSLLLFLFPFLSVLLSSPLFSSFSLLVFSPLLSFPHLNQSVSLHSYILNVEVVRMMLEDSLQKVVTETTECPLCRDLLFTSCRGQQTVYET